MPPTKPNNTKSKVASGIVVTLAVVMLVIANTVSKANQTQAANATQSSTTTQNSSSSTNTPTPSTQTTTPSTTPAPSATTSGYKDGSYTASSQYFVPHGYEQIQVNLTIKNGVVTDSTIQNSEGDRESAQFQEGFAAEYKQYVVGKNVDTLQLSRIAGASDTSQAFNDAVTQIQSQAKA